MPKSRMPKSRTAKDAKERPKDPINTKKKYPKVSESNENYTEVQKKYPKLPKSLNCT